MIDLDHVTLEAKLIVALSHVCVRMAQERVGRSGIPPLPRHQCHYFYSLCDPIIPVNRVISPSSSCLVRKPSIKIWELEAGFLFASGWQVGGEILFRVDVLNSVWILVPTVEGKGPPCCKGVH
jgi:hypothetical protein